MTITLATLNAASQQQVFDQVALHLLKQGKRSMDETNNCSYRGKDGLMCAVGCLIADDEYKPEMDKADPVTRAGTSINSLIDRGLFPEDMQHKALLNSLQEAHDNTASGDFSLVLRVVASKHDLSTAVLPVAAEPINEAAHYGVA